MEGGSSAGGAPSIELVIVTDPGPDPDDVKSITTSAIQHKAGKIRVHGVVCNGGHQALQRAKLAQALLNYLGAHDIPVAVGSAGKPYTPQPHEYAFPGVEDVQESELREGKELIRSILERAGPHSLTFLMISAMTDIAELMQEQPELVLAKVRHLSIMGGLHRTEQPDGEGGVVWEPDTAVNNNWDMESAQLMYSFCFERGIPMSVVSRNAVPNLPMSLAVIRPKPGLAPRSSRLAPGLPLLTPSGWCVGAARLRRARAEQPGVRISRQRAGARADRAVEQQVDRAACPAGGHRLMSPPGGSMGPGRSYRPRSAA